MKHLFNSAVFSLLALFCVESASANHRYRFVEAVSSSKKGPTCIAQKSLRLSELPKINTLVTARLPDGRLYELLRNEDDTLLMRVAFRKKKIGKRFCSFRYVPAAAKGKK
jgi:hypothetical protein